MLCTRKRRLFRAEAGRSFLLAAHLWQQQAACPAKSQVLGCRQGMDYLS